MLTYPKSTMHILHMLICKSSGHVTLLRGEFQPTTFSPSRTYGAGWTHVGLCPQISSWIGNSQWWYQCIISVLREFSL